MYKENLKYMVHAWYLENIKYYDQNHEPTK